LNEGEVERICKHALPRHQNWLWYFERPAAGRSGDYGFAYLWNSSRVSEWPKDKMPRILNDYQSDIRLSRNPLYGRFAPVGIGANAEFRLINIHLRWSDEVLPNRVLIIGRRKREIECRIVTGKIYRKVNSPRDGSNKPVFTMSLGDYNLDADECIAFSGNPSVVTYQREPTTLNAGSDEADPDGYASSYDHFSYDSAKNDCVSDPARRVDAVKKYFRGDFKKYRETVSDHVPVVIEIYGRQKL